MVAKKKTKNNTTYNDNIIINFILATNILQYTMYMKVQKVYQSETQGTMTMQPQPHVAT